MIKIFFPRLIVRQTFRHVYRSHRSAQIHSSATYTSACTAMTKRRNGSFRYFAFDARKPKLAELNLVTDERLLREVELTGAWYFARTEFPASNESTT